MRLDGGLPSFFLACILAELKKNVCCVNHKTQRGTMDKQSAKSVQSPLTNPLRKSPSTGTLLKTSSSIEEA